MSKILFEALGLVVVLGGTSWAQVTQRVSVDSNGAQGNQASSNGSISADGRFVAFFSDATNLVPGDTNARTDVFVRDRQTGATERVSVDSLGMEGNGNSYDPWISADGWYVAYISEATNFVAGDTNGEADVFLHDRQTGATELVSVDSGETHGNGISLYPSTSADGRYVAFRSGATNLVAGDTNGYLDIFVRDRQSGTTERVNVHSNGSQALNESWTPSISADGRYVVFACADGLLPGENNGNFDVYLRDRQSGTNELVSVPIAGGMGQGLGFEPSISADGRYVAFRSTWNAMFTRGVGSTTKDVFVRDRQNGTTERVSLDSSGMPGDDDSDFPSISADGRYVAFRSRATNLVPGDTNAALDVFVHDRQTDATELVSIRWDGTPASYHSGSPDLSADGRYVAFDSRASDILPGDTNGASDVFVRDRVGGTTFTSLCEPGAGGVIACPCSNPSGGFGQGCDNSSVTGGALLSASGGTYLSSDSLVLITLGERPTALSIVLQGNALIASGTVYGQGVRCAGGALKRLYTKTASGGSISAPDFGAGDPSVSAQSAAKGDPISAGQSRWYLVYYRDPNVLGGCPASSTFNATQTGEVSWSP